MNETIKYMLLNAPDSQLDPLLHPLIEKWDEPDATSLQILEVTDKCIHGSLASDFTVRVLQALYDRALIREGKTHQDNVIPAAKWRGCGECGSTVLHKMDCGSKSKYPLE